MSSVNTGGVSFFPSSGPNQRSVVVGFRFGDRGTHSSRTIMLAELSAAIAAAPPNGTRADYTSAIVDGNCLGKLTAATRRLTNQRLGELYGLDPTVALFRVLRRLWDLDEHGRPLLALLVALARDPLLAATMPAVISLTPGAEFQRDPARAALRAIVGGRLNDAILDKVIRNTASSWTQAGHLVGRTFKKRRRVEATAPAVAFALYLAHAVGFRGDEMLASAWVKALDCDPTLARELALAAKRLDLIDLRTAGDVLEVGLERLDPLSARS